MSEPTSQPQPTRPKHPHFVPQGRRPVLAIILGLLLVAVVVTAGLLVVRATDDSLEPPEQLGDYTELSRLTGAELGDFVKSSQEVNRSLADNLEEVYDADATVASYVDVDPETDRPSLETQIRLTVIDREPGPFGAQEAQPDPELTGRNAIELIREDDATCIVRYPQVSPEEDQGDPIGVQCQSDEGPRTYQLGTVGLSVAETVDLLEEAAGR